MKDIKLINFANVEVPRLDLSETQGYYRWVKYGDDNLFPKMLNELLKKSPTHSALVNAKSLAIKGDGFETSEEVEKWMSDNTEKSYGESILDKIANDLAIQDSFALQIVYNRARNGVAKIYHIPSGNLRKARSEPGYYYCDDWEFYSKLGVKYLPEFDWDNRMEQATQILYVRKPSNLSRFYGVPSYTSALNAVFTEYEIGKYQLSLLDNCVLPTNVINVPMDDMDEDSRNEFAKKFSEQFQGAESAGRHILMFGGSDEEAAKTTVQKIENGIEPDLFENVQQQVRQSILSAHNATSPLLASIPSQNGFSSNTDELKYSWMIYNKQVAAGYHRMIEDVFVDILRRTELGDVDLNIKPYMPEIENK